MAHEPFTLRRAAALSAAEIDALTHVLLDCVAGGASVSFVHPLSFEKAQAFWRRIAADVARGARACLVAEDASGIIGTVHLVLEQPDNQPHRADVSKMLVHRRARCRGIGAALMSAAEDVARESGKSVLVLDTASGDAERLYRRLGWTELGTIPNYALWPDGRLCGTTIFYRELK